MTTIKTTTAYLLELHFKRPLVSEMTHLSSVDDVYQYIRENIDMRLINHKEFFWIILLTRSHRVLGMKQISAGRTDSTLVSIKEIAQVSILSNACACILVHNHPSGNLRPSSDDKRITERIGEVLKLIEITLLDHIIITQESYYSFSENHLIHPS